MPDYRRTEELFKAEKILHLYKKPPGQLDDELFYAKVTNPETNTFYQIPDLPLEYRKNLQQNKTYPVREVYQIYRIKRLDGTEWLKSRGRIVGLDRLGNEVEHSFTDPEIYYKPQTQYAMRDKDPNDSSKGKERKCIAAGINEASAEYREYTLPFNAKNFEQLFNRGQVNPQPQYLWQYMKKDRVKSRGKLQTMRSLKVHHLTNCGLKLPQ